MTCSRDEAIRLYDAYTHEHLDRRRLLREMTALAGSVAAAEALIGAIGASSAAAQVVPANDKRITSEPRMLSAGTATLNGFYAEPTKGVRKHALVLIVHENRGLNDHIRDVTRRIALTGLPAFAPDYLSRVGGTPTDQDQARALIGKLDLNEAITRTVAVLTAVKKQMGARGRIGAVGFCWGGAFVNRLAVAAGPELAAGVSYYGPAPAPSEAAKVQAAMMVHLAGNDSRVNTTGLPWIEALKAAGKKVEGHVYPGAEHAFNNDTSAERHDKQAADLAWRRTVAFLRRELDA